MGSSGSRELQEDPVFVVPNHLPFSAEQLAALLAQGQQQGVPFAISRTGGPLAEEQALRAPVLRSAFSVDRGITARGDPLQLSMQLDALVPCLLTVHLGVAAATAPASLSLASAVARLRLDAGMGQHVDEQRLGLEVTAADIRAARAAAWGGRVAPFDVVLVLRPDGGEASTAHATCLQLQLEGDVGATPEGGGAPSSPSSPSRSGVAHAVQKVQWAQGVFLLHELYGLERKAPPVPDPDRPGIMSAVAESSDCVICLSQPREVALLPCRHTVVCSSCAESLPRQENRCPLCRRRAVLSIHLRPDATQLEPPTDDGGALAAAPAAAGATPASVQC